MNKHTPTPWHAPGFAEVMDKDNRVIALCVDVDPVEEKLRPVPEIDEGQANAEFIARCVNSHDALVRIAELVQHAVQNRADRDWTQMHLDLSEAAEMAKLVAPLAAAGAPQ